MFLFHVNCLGQRNHGVKVAEQEQLCPWSFPVAQFTCLAAPSAKTNLWDTFLQSRFISPCTKQLSKICPSSCFTCSPPLPLILWLATMRDSRLNPTVQWLIFERGSTSLPAASLHRASNPTVHLVCLAGNWQLSPLQSNHGEFREVLFFWLDQRFALQPPDCSIQSMGSSVSI